MPKVSTITNIITPILIASMLSGCVAPEKKTPQPQLKPGANEQKSFSALNIGANIAFQACGMKSNVYLAAPDELDVQSTHELYSPTSVRTSTQDANGRVSVAVSTSILGQGKDGLLAGTDTPTQDKETTDLFANNFTNTSLEPLDPLTLKGVNIAVQACLLQAKESTSNFSNLLSVKDIDDKTKSILTEYSSTGNLETLGNALSIILSNNLFGSNYDVSNILKFFDIDQRTRDTLTVLLSDSNLSENLINALRQINTSDSKDTSQTDTQVNYDASKSQIMMNVVEGLQQSTGNQHIQVTTAENNDALGLFIFNENNSIQVQTNRIDSLLQQLFPGDYADELVRLNRLVFARVIAYQGGVMSTWEAYNSQNPENQSIPLNNSFGEALALAVASIQAPASADNIDNGNIDLSAISPLAGSLYEALKSNPDLQGRVIEDLQNGNSSSVIKDILNGNSGDTTVDSVLASDLEKITGQSFQNYTYLDMMKELSIKITEGKITKEDAITIWNRIIKVNSPTSALNHEVSFDTKKINYIAGWQIIGRTLLLKSKDGTISRAELTQRQTNAIMSGNKKALESASYRARKTIA